MEPLPGVMNATQAFFDECFYGDSSIDLSWEMFCREYRLTHDLPEDAEIPDEICEVFEDDEPNYLIGDWDQDKDGLYFVSPNCNGMGFAARLGYLGGAPLITVHWSKFTRHVRAMCSPCCPGQADLDSGDGNIEAYAPPMDWYWDGE